MSEEVVKVTNKAAVKEKSQNLGENVVSALNKDPIHINPAVTEVTSISSGSLKNDPEVKIKLTRANRAHEPTLIPAHIHVIKTSAGESNPIYCCSVCGKKFKSKAHINYHAYCQNKDKDKPFKCEKCQKGFISRAHFEYHQRVHTGDKPFQCPECGKRFSQRGKLTLHQKAVHSRERPFACEQCQKPFANKKQLNLHTRIHTGERPFACTTCDKRFSRLISLKEHVTTHTGERPFICDQCGKSFGRKYALDLHLKTHSNELPFACDQCSKAFSNGKDFRCHCLTHTNALLWICFLCDDKLKFGRVHNLSRHIKKAHGIERLEEAMTLAKEAAAQFLKEKCKNTTVNKDHFLLNAAVTQVACASADDSISPRRVRRRPNPIPTHIKTLSCGPTRTYQCTPCGKKFKTKAHIKYHAFCQDKDGDKPFKCLQCGKGFVARNHYEYHVRVHSGELPFPCPQCGKRFNQRGKLTRHQKAVHSHERPFACEQCQKTFSSKQFLQVHTRTHTGEKPYACTYCDKRFTGMTNLKKHVTSHTGERPFVCDQCGKAFGLKWALDFHLRTHSHERPFACDQCPKAFSNGKDLRRHCLTHTNARPWICFICDDKPGFRRGDNLSRHIKNVHGKERLEEVMKLAKEAAIQYLKEYTGNKDHSSINAAVTEMVCAPAGDQTHRRPVFRRRRKRRIKNTPTVEQEETVKCAKETATKCAEMLKTSGEDCVISDTTTSGQLMNTTRPPSSHDQEQGMKILESTENVDSFEGMYQDSSHHAEIAHSENSRDHVPLEVNATAVIDEARYSNLSEVELLAAESMLSLSSSNISVNTIFLVENNCLQESDSVFIFDAPTADHENSQENEQNNSFDCTVTSGIPEDDQDMTVATDTAIGSDIYATAPPVAINETHNLVVVDISENKGGLGVEQSVYVCYTCLQTFDTMAQFTTHEPCQESLKDDEAPLPAVDAIPVLENISESGNEIWCSFNPTVEANSDNNSTVCSTTNNDESERAVAQETQSSFLLQITDNSIRFLIEKDLSSAYPCHACQEKFPTLEKFMEHVPHCPTLWEKTALLPMANTLIGNQDQTT